VTGFEFNISSGHRLHQTPSKNWMEPKLSGRDNEPVPKKGGECQDRAERTDHTDFEEKKLG
jgi:hypothetical protein